MTVVRGVLVAALISGLIPVAAPACAQGTPDTSVRELRQRLQTLQQQITELNATTDTALRQRLMHQNWQGLQDYMRWMRDRWGVGYPWMMGDRMMGDRMMGGPMMGGTRGAAWPLPQGMGPAQYQQQLRDHMQWMQEHMNVIGQTVDSQQRQRMLREYWQTMYQRMQTMRGMGWMWAGPMGPGMMWRPMPGAGTAKPLPEPGSRGATLVGTYCTQCHAAPSPTLHTSAEWAGVTRRMLQHMQSGLTGIKTPSEEAMRVILDYMQRHAR